MLLRKVSSSVNGVSIDGFCMRVTCTGKLTVSLTWQLKTGGREGKGGMVHGVRSLGRATVVLSFKYRHGQLRYLVGRWMLRMGYSSRYLPLQDVSRLITTENPPNGPGNGSYRTREYWWQFILPSGRQSQERTVRELRKRVRKLNYSIPGV